MQTDGAEWHVDIARWQLTWCLDWRAVARKSSISLLIRARATSTIRTHYGSESFATKSSSQHAVRAWHRKRQHHDPFIGACQASVASLSEQMRTWYVRGSYHPPQRWCQVVLNTGLSTPLPSSPMEPPLAYCVPTAASLKTAAQFNN